MPLAIVNLNVQRPTKFRSEHMHGAPEPAPRSALGAPPRRAVCNYTPFEAAASAGAYVWQWRPRAQPGQARSRHIGVGNRRRYSSAALAGRPRPIHYPAVLRGVGPFGSYWPRSTEADLPACHSPSLCIQLAMVVYVSWVYMSSQPSQYCCWQQVQDSLKTPAGTTPMPFQRRFFMIKVLTPCSVAY